MSMCDKNINKLTDFSEVERIVLSLYSASVFDLSQNQDINTNCVKVSMDKYLFPKI